MYSKTDHFLTKLKIKNYIDKNNKNIFFKKLLLVS